MLLLLLRWWWCIVDIASIYDVVIGGDEYCWLFETRAIDGDDDFYIYLFTFIYLLSFTVLLFDCHYSIHFVFDYYFVGIYLTILHLCVLLYLFIVICCYLWPQWSSNSLRPVLVIVPQTFPSVIYLHCGIDDQCWPTRGDIVDRPCWHCGLLTRYGLMMKADWRAVRGVVVDDPYRGSDDGLITCCYTIVITVFADDLIHCYLLVRWRDLVVVLHCWAIPHNDDII